jgi:hypothetical protein
MRVLVAAIVTMSVAQLLDLATFDVMVRQLGPDAEGNPLVATLYAAHGLPVVAVAKVALIALVTAVVAVIANPTMRRAQARIVVLVVLALAIAAGVVGGATNAAAIGLL